MEAMTITQVYPAKPKRIRPEPEPYFVFNRTNGLLAYSIPGFPLIEIPPHRWVSTYKPVTKQDKNKDGSAKVFPRSFVTNHLMSDPRITVRLPYARFGARDESHLTIGAALDPLTGWGKMNFNIINELAKLRGHPVAQVVQKDWSVKSNEGSLESDLFLHPISYWQQVELPQNVLELMEKPSHPTKWGLALTIPTEYPNMPCRNLVAMAMWETGSVPDDWVVPLKQVRHLIVPATSQVEVFRKVYDGDISVVPLGVDTDVFQYQERPQRGEDEPFTILLYGSPLSSRKSPMETIMEVCWLAFGDVFGEPIDDWKLILKSRHNVFGAGAFGNLINDSHVETISGDYTDEQMVDLCYRSDVGIVLSKYEGYGLVFREMMATGLPVIVSANTGHTDDCDPMFNIPIPTEREMSAEEAYSGNEDWRWEQPDWEYAARELRFQYNTWKLRGRTQSPLGTRAAEYIKANRTWNHTATKLNDILNKVIQ